MASASVMLLPFPQFSPEFFCLSKFQTRLHCFTAFSWQKSRPSYEAAFSIFMPSFYCFLLSMQERFSYLWHFRAYSQEYQDFCDYKKGKIVFEFTWVRPWSISISCKGQYLWSFNFKCIKAKKENGYVLQAVVAGDYCLIWEASFCILLIKYVKACIGPNMHRHTFWFSSANHNCVQNTQF